MLRAIPRPTNPDEALDRAIDVAITAGLVVLILVGFVTSYRTLCELAATVGGYPTWLAPAVPLSFDLGIVVLSLKVGRASREGRTAPVLRLLVAGLSTATVVVNASAAQSDTARLLHAVPPGMFVVCFESVVITARRRALQRRGLVPEPLPHLRLARWVLAPRSSWTAWRQMVLAHAPEGEVSSTSPSPQALSMSKTHSAITTPTSGGRSRERFVSDAICSHPEMTARELMRQLASHGHAVSLRTAQRLRAASVPTSAPHGE